MPDLIEEILTRGVVEILPNKEGLSKLMRRQKMRLYNGIDPTSPNIHLGNAVPLLKLKQFQDLGHEVILLIGSFTAQIGDPSGHDEARKPLTPKEIKKNLAAYTKQASKIIDFKRTKLMFNGDWLSKMTFADVIKLASNFTVQQVIERDLFRRRLKKRAPIWLNEFLYPLAQGYDSVAMNVDLEIGGTDQTFNMLAGRTLQKIYNKKEKFVLTLSLIPGLDGRKMSKTYGNTVNLTDPPNEMYGKIMSLKDELTMQYFELCTKVPMGEIKILAREARKDPMGAKKRLALEITKIYHGEKKATEAQKEFEKVFEKRRAPQTMPEIKIKEKRLSATDLLVKCKLAKSKSEARRLIEQKGVKLNGRLLTINHKPLTIKDGMVIRVGKRRFVKIRH